MIIADSKDFFIKIKKEDVAFASSFLKAYQYYFSFRTPKPAQEGYCNLHLIVSPDFIDEFKEIMLALSKEVKIEWNK